MKAALHVPVSELSLHALAPRGTRLFTELRHVNRDNTAREISVLVYDPTSSDFRNLDSMVADLLDMKLGLRCGITVRGGGMDMGFALIDQLARRLHGDARALTQTWL